MQMRGRRDLKCSLWFLAVNLRFHHDVHIFKNFSRRDAQEGIAGLHQVVSGESLMLATQRIGEHQRFGELLCADQKAGAVNVPIIGSGFGHGSCLVSWLSALGSWFLVLGSWFLVLGSWFLVLVS